MEKEKRMYQEEESFNLRFSLEANFPDEDEGEEDERAWLAHWNSTLTGWLAFAIEEWQLRTKLKLS